MKRTRKHVMKCANCGKKIPDATYKNIDGEQCCRECWIAEEDKLKNS